MKEQEPQQNIQQYFKKYKERGATVLTDLKGNQIINGKTLTPKKITAFLDIDIDKLIDLEVNDLTIPAYHLFEKDLIEVLLSNNNYNDLVICIWAIDITIDPYTYKDENKIRIFTSIYVDAIIK